ncbi:MAG: GAF domain-containing SpoIIE family protein phosphatase [Kofleriaceae bacterium]
MPAEFAWRLSSAPYLGASVVLAGLGVVTALVRGDKVMRVALLAIVGSGLPWAMGYALATGTDEAAVAVALLRAGNGPVALGGPAILLLVLAGAGQLEQRQRLVVVATLLALGSMVLAWSTPWMVRDAWQLPSGTWYVRAGPLLVPHVAQLLLWSAVGLVLARHGVGRDRARVRGVHVVAAIAIAAVTAHDTLLAYGVRLGPPLAWAALAIAVAAVLWKIVVDDLLRARGLDGGAADELGLTVIGAAATMAVVGALAGSTHRLLLAAAAAPVPVAGAAVAMWLRARARAERGAPPAVDVVHAATSLEELAAFAATRWQAIAPVDAVTLWIVADEVLRTPGGRTIDAGPPSARLALARTRRVVVQGDLSTAWLGEVRGPLEHLLRSCGPDLVYPLVEGDRLIGVIGARRRGERAIRGREREALAEIGATVGRTLTYLARAHAAEVAADAAREVEVAEATRAQMAAHARAELVGWRLAAASRPTAGLALEAWAWEALDARRLAVLVADVAGRGVPAALLSSALVGAFVAAARSSVTSNSAVTLAKALDRAIRELAPSARVAAFVAVLDAGSGRLEWANAGHRGGTLVRRGVGGPAYRIGGDSAPLGGGTVALATGAVRVEPDQVLVVLSEGALTAPDRRGRPWGDARLGEVLGQWAARDDEPELADMVLGAIAAYTHDQPARDDVLVVTVAPAAS